MSSTVLQTRRLGRTSLLVTRIGLGLAALGRPGYINLGHADDLMHRYDPAQMERNAHSVLDAAWAAGVRYFDVARSYGRGEEFLAAWLRSRTIDPAEVVVGSKWGYTYTAGWRTNADQHEIKDHRIAAFQRQWGESRVILGEQIDLYQIHSATLESGVLDDVDVLDALARLKEAGVAVGLSVSGPRQPDVIRKAINVRRGGAALFDAVQATWNLLEPSAGPALQDAHDAGIGVIVKEALANGRLTRRNHEPDFAAQRRRLQVAADQHQCTLEQLALAAVLDQPWADVVLSGAATVEQLVNHAAAASIRVGPAAQELSDVAEPPETYWRLRAAMSWN